MNSITDKTIERIFSLDSLRGIACLIVYNWHFALGFMPVITGVVASNSDYSWTKLPIFVFINGSSAVVVFYVLSSYILVDKFFIEEKVQILAERIIKRWFRLSLLTLSGTTISWFLFRLNIYNFKEAAQITGSNWLATFGYASQIPTHNSILSAIYQGIFGVFFQGEAYFDSSLWTIKTEFTGSLIVIPVAVIFLEFRKSQLSLLLLSFTYFMLFNQFNIYMNCFLMGMITSFICRIYHLEKYINKFSNLGIISVFVGSILILGFKENQGFYRFLPHFLASKHNIVYVYTFSACVLIALLQSKFLLKFLTKKPFLYLGKISYPFYVIHILSLFSVGSWIFILGWQKIPTYLLLIITYFICLACSLLVSNYLIILDMKWQRFIRAVYRRFNGVQ
ncbi:acyltransferase family protein [Nostoc sp. XA010]|uniref:acyltransferase family protein n=1 Tax=Nostoc sp. XA010 TaxID=2780407 RepID=UPI001E5DA6B1|nr:acyltransferase family protein [Nostoc sp. XA010]MCC5658557.1 acyltransferase family protein [Nostoc sp. XA010]